MLTICLLFCSGAIGAEWLKAFNGYIENPVFRVIL